MEHVGVESLLACVASIAHQKRQRKGWSTSQPTQAAGRENPSSITAALQNMETAEHVHSTVNSQFKYVGTFVTNSGNFCRVVVIVHLLIMMRLMGKVFLKYTRCPILLNLFKSQIPFFHYLHVWTTKSKWVYCVISSATTVLRLIMPTYRLITITSQYVLWKTWRQKESWICCMNWRKDSVQCPKECTDWLQTMYVLFGTKLSKIFCGPMWSCDMTNQNTDTVLANVHTWLFECKCFVDKIIFTSWFYVYAYRLVLTFQ